MSYFTTHLSISLLVNLLLSLTVREFWKSVNIWRSYRQDYSVLFFWLTLIIVCLFMSCASPLNLFCLHFFLTYLLFYLSFENRPALVFLCLFYVVVHFFLMVNANFCSVSFGSFSIPSQSHGSGKRVQNGPFCVKWGVKPQSVNAASLCPEMLPLQLCRHYLSSINSSWCLQCFDTVGWAAGRASGL